jgi:hypothetical protein
MCACLFPLVSKISKDVAFNTAATSKPVWSRPTRKEQLRNVFHYRWGYMKILQVSAGLVVNLASKLANTRFWAILCNKLTCWWDIQRLTRKPWPMAIKSNQVWTKPAALHFTSARSTAIWLPLDAATPLLSRGASATFALGSLGTDWYCPRGLLRSSQLPGPSQGLQQNFPCGGRSKWLGLRVTNESKVAASIQKQ